MISDPKTNEVRLAKARPDIPSPYSEWMRKEGVPVIGGLAIMDVRADLPMAYWPRKGVRGAFINLLGAEESLDAYVIEIPPQGHTKPEKYFFEEEVVVLSGRGASTIWLEGERHHNFEWKAGSAFSPPLNCWRQHFNGSATEPVRLLIMSNAPVMFNVLRSEQIIFECSHVCRDRFSGEEGYFSGKGTALPNRGWRSNFIPDISNFPLVDYSIRGAGGTVINFEMANNVIKSHIASFPVATYKLAHRHGPGAHILILSGEGYSLMWEDKNKPIQRIDWKTGSLLVPPDMWFHQHFNTGSEPARYFAVHYGYWRIVVESVGPEAGRQAAGLEISYEDEDPIILQSFEAELAKNDIKARPLEEWRRQ